MLKRVANIRYPKTDNQLIDDMMSRGWPSRKEAKKCIDPNYRAKFVAIMLKSYLEKINEF